MQRLFITAIEKPCKYNIRQVDFRQIVAAKSKIYVGFLQQNYNNEKWNVKNDYTQGLHHVWYICVKPNSQSTQTYAERERERNSEMETEDKGIESGPNCVHTSLSTAALLCEHHAVPNREVGFTFHVLVLHMRGGQFLATVVHYR